MSANFTYKVCKILILGKIKMSYVSNRRLFVGLILSFCFLNTSYGAFSLFDDGDIDIEAAFRVAAQLKDQREMDALREEALAQEARDARHRQRRRAEAKENQQYKQTVGRAQAICIILDGLNYDLTPAMEKFSKNSGSEVLAQSVLDEFTPECLQMCKDKVSDLLRELTSGESNLSYATESLGKDFLKSGRTRDGRDFFNAFHADTAFDKKLHRRMRLFKDLRLSAEGTDLPDYRAEKKDFPQALGVAGQLRRANEAARLSAEAECFKELDDDGFDMAELAHAFGDGDEEYRHSQPKPTYQQKRDREYHQSISGKNGPLAQIEAVAVRRVRKLFDLRQGYAWSDNEEAFGRDTTSYKMAWNMVSEWHKNGLLNKLLDQLYPVHQKPSGHCHRVSGRCHHADPGHDQGVSHGVNSGLPLDPIDYTPDFLGYVKKAMIDTLITKPTLRPIEQEFMGLAKAKSKDLRLYELGLIIADDHKLLEGMTESGQSVWANDES